MPMICTKIPNCKEYEADPSVENMRCINKECEIAPAWSRSGLATPKPASPSIDDIEDFRKQKSEGKKFDDDKLRFDLIPPEVEKAMATILTFGAKKYGANCWQTLDDFKNRFTAALMRHLNAWRSGEEDDPESGYPHLWHIACNVAFLIWYEEYSGPDEFSVQEFMQQQIYKETEE